MTIFWLKKVKQVDEKSGKNRRPLLYGLKRKVQPPMPPPSSFIPHLSLDFNHTRLEKMLGFRFTSSCFWMHTHWTKIVLLSSSLEICHFYAVPDGGDASRGTLGGRCNWNGRRLANTETTHSGRNYGWRAMQFGLWTASIDSSPHMSLL